MLLTDQDTSAAKHLILKHVIKDNRKIQIRNIRYFRKQFFVSPSADNFAEDLVLYIIKFQKMSCIQRCIVSALLIDMLNFLRKLRNRRTISERMIVIFKINRRGYIIIVLPDQKTVFGNSIIFRNFMKQNRRFPNAAFYFLLKIFDKFLVTHTQPFPAMQKSPVEWIFLCKFTVTY